MSSYAKMTVAQLKEELKKQGLETSGVKKDLVERLEAAGGEKAEPEEKPTKAKGKGKGKKRAKEEEEDAEEEEEAPAKKQKTETTTTTSSSSKKKAPSSVPIDKVALKKHPQLMGSKVYIEGDVVWSVMLNQTNIAQNNNKYYVIQLLEKGGSYFTYNRWGRVGDDGQDALKSCNLSGAKDDFAKKFKDKTSNQWANGGARGNFDKRQGKYDLLDMDYGDDETEAVVEQLAKTSNKKVKVRDCGLDDETQALIRLICDNDMFKQQLVHFNIDIKRMPLGKLSKDQLQKGFDVLEELMSELKSGTTSNAEKLSSRFYTIIPHEYPRSVVPPVLKQQEAVQEKMNMLEVLGDIVIAQNMLKQAEHKDVEEVDHPLDLNYKKLGNELSLVKKNSNEFKIIDKYFENTKVQGSTAKLLQVWCLDRNGEKKRSDKFKHVTNRKLLWHGTKVAVICAILSTGLRILPHSGGRVGRGIYSASECAKSAGYVGTALDGGKNIGIMFLNEVILGKEHHITKDDPSLVSAPKGFDSVVALGRVEPDSAHDVTIDGEWGPITVPQAKASNTSNGASNFFNSEYLVYDEGQIRQKYLLKIQF